MKYKGIPIADIVFYKHPLIYLQLSAFLFVDLANWLKTFIIKRLFLILILAISWGLVNYIPQLNPIKEFVEFSFYWILLGVASSIGLGTGLHTFVLYLGPHIAKVTMVATACGHLPAMLPSRWNFDHFGKCEDNSQVIGFIGILLAVQLESFLWGFGTALGELPPYFVAKKAAETNQQLLKMQLQAEKKEAKTNEEKKRLIETAEQINQIQFLRNKPDKTIMDRAKIIIFDNLEKYGFITILLCASIPNPLFDLAGITCGHFKIPFKKFFTATFIGKAIIKVHIQMLFVITTFRKETVNYLLGFVNKIHQGLGSILSTALEKQRQALHHSAQDENGENIIARLWNMFIILMVGYFVLSIITSQVQQKAVQKKDKVQ